MNGVMPIMELLVAGLIIALVAGLATGIVLRFLKRRVILDVPNQRSSHAVPTPRGGGIAVVFVIVVAWAGMAVATADVAALLVVALASIIALVSWLDDLWGLPIAFRLLAQAAAVAIGALLLPGEGQVFQGLLPPNIDAVLAAFLWLWFVNLFNFMDGIDGIAGGEAASVGIGLMLVTLAAGDPPLAAYYPLAVAAAALGFLKWNWPPAKIFLGDTGSVTLGFFLGWLLLDAAARGQWAAAAILPLYFLADATITLLRRLFKGEKIWRAHRSHFYQQGARRLGGHKPVVLRILAGNAALMALALLTVLAPAWAIICVFLAAVPIGVLLWYFAEPAKDLR
jgi:UDP-N-acetylmuramyl pentapeptide phosphotransferase/UDP-N-acetylglucosamine-1-phosphate transferase